MSRKLRFNQKQAQPDRTNQKSQNNETQRNTTKHNETQPNIINHNQPEKASTYSMTHNQISVTIEKELKINPGMSKPIRRKA